MTAYDFGLVGLGVMGRNFILNVADRGFPAIGLDTDVEKVNALRQEGAHLAVGSETELLPFVKALKLPRKIMLLVPAGGPVDDVLESLLPLLAPGDVVIDGGNSFFQDTDQRIKRMESTGIHFLGSGVSGGAKGARFGPSLMPGGTKEAYELIRPVFEAAAAKVQEVPCVAWMGNGSAGHYVKMVHNGIEYGLMQLIAESYDLAVKGLGLTAESAGQLFSRWNTRALESFLIEITSEALTKKDDLTDQPLVDLILDKAGQKGTGRWTSQNAMELGVATPTLDAGGLMRAISAQKSLREKLDTSYPKPITSTQGITEEMLEEALQFASIIAYTQGMAQLSGASSQYQFGLNLHTIATIWRGGCIIRARLLEDIRRAYEKQPDLPSLLLDEAIREQLVHTEQKARKVAAFALKSGIPALGLTSAVSYFDAFRSGRLPLNLVQAQRDHFGAHTYERTDRPGIFQTEW